MDSNHISDDEELEDYMKIEEVDVILAMCPARYKTLALSQLSVPL